ncbi:MAG: Calx-beta domain-containing protein [Actinomycetota bacterium]
MGALRGSGRRRVVASLAAGLGAAGLLVIAQGAGAGVSNPGAFDITLSNGTLAIDGASIDVAFDGLTGTGSGTVTPDGTVSIAALVLPPFDFELLATGGPGTGIPGTASPVATLPWSGTIDPDTGELTVSGDLITNVAVPALGASQCPLGPLALNMTTGTSGASMGVAYDDTTGTASIVDHLFGIPALVFDPDNAAACPTGVVDLFNGGLPFPVPSTFARIAFDVAVDPILAGTTTTTTVAPTTTTTTVAPTTTTTTPPGAAVGSIEDVSRRERHRNTSRWTFDVELSEPLDHAVVVSWQTVDGSATAGSDYIAKAGSFRLQRGKTSWQVQVVVLGDLTPEDDETFQVAITSVTGAGEGSDGTGEIRNDDGASNGDTAAAFVMLLLGVARTPRKNPSGRE